VRPVLRADRAAAPVGLRLTGLSKAYGDTTVVRSLDLEVEPGEFVSMLGPSGSGKTTTLKMIAGFETPGSGTITFDAQDVTDLPPERRDVGVVFQNYSLFPHLDVGANVAFPLRMRGVPKSERSDRVRRALELVELGGYERRRVGQLSGGQQQRVAIARAVVFEPRLLLMDEPLGALDRRLREAMQLEIKALHERLGVTVVYVTHDQEEALTMSDRVVLFRDGGIEQVGTPREVYERPRTLFAADFLGDSLSLAGRRVSPTTVELAGVGAVEVPAEPGVPSGPVRMIWRPRGVEVHPPAPRSGTGALASVGVLRVPVEVVTGGFAGELVKLRIRFPWGEEGVVTSSSPGLDHRAGARVDVVLDVSAAVVLPALS
jgi:putative spermidine/putrescine transport system ATP-binding protein